MKTRLAGIALATGMALGLSGCGFVVPVATNDPYEPSDGVSAEVGDLVLRNILLVTDDGETGSLVFTVINSGDSAERVELTYSGNTSGSTLVFDVPSDTTYVVGAPDNVRSELVGKAYSDAYELTEIDALPGSLIEITLSSGGDEVEIVVPVLNAELPEYSHLK